MTGGGGEGRPAPRALSVLMVAWGRQDLLDASLGAVRRFLPGAQAVVVDNGSEPPLRLPAGVEAVRAPRNLGFAGGNNLGLARCTGDYVLLLNTDAVLPSAEPTETLLAFLEAHPGVAVAQAKLRLPDGTLDACGEGLTPLGLLYHHGYRRPDGPHAARPRPVFAAKAACALVRRAAIADAGGLFRPRFFCYYEDIDFCHRLWLAGWECWFVPTEPVAHAEGATSRTLPARQVWRRYLSNMLCSAFDLWGWRLWLGRGLPFLAAVFAGGLARGVLPRPFRDPMPVRRRVPEAAFLPRVTVRPPWRYYLGLARRGVSGAFCGGRGV